MVQPIVAEAHPLHWTSESIGFLSGLIHPLSSPDHIFIMLIVGFWISQASRLTTKIISLVFVALMLIGGGLTLIPVEIVNAEHVMNVLALTLGLMLASGYKVSSMIATFIVGNLALFHGYAHAYDIWLDRNAFSYTAGFALATVALIAVGICIRSLIDRIAPKNVTHLLGGVSQQ